MFDFSSADRLPALRGFVEPAVFDTPDKFAAVMIEAVAYKVSDIFITVGEPILFEINGDLKPITARRLSYQEVLRILDWGAGDNTASIRIARGEDVPAAYAVPDPDPSMKDARGYRIEHRFRVNGSRITFRGGAGCQIVIRAIDANPSSLEKVRMEKAIVDAAFPLKGIVYFTGATGSGKTTSFSALIRHVIEGHTPIHGNICTLEAPIEYVYSGIASKSLVVQQEVGPSKDCPTFADGVRSLMRRHPGLGVVGEVRDQETAAAAVELSNTGHPVYATVHSDSVALTFSRIAKLFPEESRGLALTDLIGTTRLIVNQALVKRVGGGRVALREYLVVTDDLREEMMMRIETVRDSMVVLRDLVDRFGRSMSVAAQQAFEEGLIDDLTLKLYLRSRAEQNG